MQGDESDRCIKTKYRVTCSMGHIWTNGNWESRAKMSTLSPKMAKMCTNWSLICPFLEKNHLN